jgi:hypothetical protein
MSQAEVKTLERSKILKTRTMGQFHGKHIIT